MKVAFTGMRLQVSPHCLEWRALRVIE
jgi:hypothetical protein